MMPCPGYADSYSMINTISTVAFYDTSNMVGFVSTRRAFATFARSLGKNLKARNIRVNAVAPDPAHTSLRPVSLPAEQMEGSGKSTGVEHSELATRFVFLASKDSELYYGQILDSYPLGD
jgi:short-subunit dehydrogenase